MEEGKKRIEIGEKQIGDEFCNNLTDEDCSPQCVCSLCLRTCCICLYAEIEYSVLLFTHIQVLYTP